MEISTRNGTSKTARADEIITLHNEIIGYFRQSLEKAIRIGGLLTEQKRTLKHGGFTNWISDNLPFTDRTARNYMRLYENKNKLKTENISDLTSAYKLLSEPHKKEMSAEEEALKVIESLKAKYKIDDIPSKEALRKEFDDICLIEDLQEQIALLQSFIKRCKSYVFNAAAFGLEIEVYIGKLLKEIKECDAILESA